MLMVVYCRTIRPSSGPVGDTVAMRQPDIALNGAYAARGARDLALGLS